MSLMITNAIPIFPLGKWSKSTDLLRARLSLLETILITKQPLLCSQPNSQSSQLSSLYIVPRSMLSVRTALRFCAAICASVLAQCDPSKPADVRCRSVEAVFRMFHIIHSISSILTAAPYISSDNVFHSTTADCGAGTDDEFDINSSVPHRTSAELRCRWTAGSLFLGPLLTSPNGPEAARGAVGDTNAYSAKTSVAAAASVSVTAANCTVSPTSETDANGSCNGGPWVLKNDCVQSLGDSVGVLLDMLSDGNDVVRECVVRVLGLTWILISPCAAEEESASPSPSPHSEGVSMRTIVLRALREVQNSLPLPTSTPSLLLKSKPSIDVPTAVADSDTLGTSDDEGIIRSYEKRLNGIFLSSLISI